MKHLLRSWKQACCAAVSMMFVACGGGSDYRDVLPADSFFTLSVDVASLFEKSGAGPLEQHPLYARLESELSAVDVLTPEEKVAACRVVSMSGADFIKTSTGFSSGGATVEDVKLFRAHVSPDVRIKAAGGIRTFAQAQAMLDAGADRIGSSALVPLARQEGLD